MGIPGLRHSGASKVRFFFDYSIVSCALLININIGGSRTASSNLSTIPHVLDVARPQSPKE